MADSMEQFRTNLSPLEVKRFLKIVSTLTEDLLIRYCFKVKSPCPQCGREGLCQSAGLSFYSSSFDKLTHEIIACLHCGYVQLSTLLNVERL